MLYVEDDVIARKFTLPVLKAFPITLDVAETGQEALNLVQKKSYDLIFLDLGLPDITGFEMTRTLRTQKGPNQKTPIFALTAHDEEGYEERSLDSGMTGFLKKPLTTEHCQAVMRSIIKDMYGKSQKQ